MTLAITEEASIIAIAPPEILDLKFTAERLAEYLDVDQDWIEERLRKNLNRRFFYLKRQVDNYIADQIIELNLPGVYREREFKRIYPADSLAGNLLGFVSRDRNLALAGLERTYQEILTTPEKRNARRGPNLELTLDSLIQYSLERELGRAFESSGAKRGVGILMNIQTGEVLALANFPNYNPGEYASTTPFERANWAIRFNYEPGSTIKVIMAAILLAEEAVDPDEKFFCDGVLKFGDSTISCKFRNKIHKHGHLNLQEILTKSCNVGIIQAMQRIKRERLYHYMSKLGFGEKTRVLPGDSGETRGYFPPLGRWVPSTGYYMPIGQSFSATPLQLLRAISSIAAGGKLAHPFIAGRIVRSDETVIEGASPILRDNPFPPRVNRRVLEMMRGVVIRGTGRAANIPEIAIAGKTGTGQKATAAGYGDKSVASFVGFFPADKPRYGMLILYDEPDGFASGGSLAAPVFRDVVRRILPLIDRDAPRVIVKSDSLPGYEPPRVNTSIMHDFTGLSARTALSIIIEQYNKTRQIPLQFELIGAGYVFRQWPAPGVTLENVEKIRLYLDSR